MVLEAIGLLANTRSGQLSFGLDTTTEVDATTEILADVIGELAEWAR